jgi:hypothetical protein
MKAHEAIAILESLDPNREVTLTIGAAQPKTMRNLPKWQGLPVYPYQDSLINKDFNPPFTVTCGTVH